MSKKTQSSQASQPKTLKEVKSQKTVLSHGPQGKSESAKNLHEFDFKINTNSGTLTFIKLILRKS